MRSTCGLASRTLTCRLEAWDQNGDGIVSLAEFAEGLQGTDLLTRLDAAEADGALEAEEFASGLFGVADADEDDQLGEDEDGLLTEIAEFLAPAGDEGEPVAEGDILDVEEPANGEVGFLESQEEEPLAVFDEAFMQLPIPCGGAGESCEQVAQRFCETLGHGEPVAFLDVEGSLYAIRCKDDI